MKTLKAGDELQGGKYIIKKVLGHGGFGITYLAVQEILDRQVAIKEFFFKDFYDRDTVSGNVIVGSSSKVNITDKFLQKFIKEAKTISRLRHPNIIQIYDIFRENNTAYYVMEYIEGESLSELVKNEGALSEPLAIDYIKSTASALSFIHERNIAHLDVKPGNIMMRKSDRQIILIDFGVAKQYDEVSNEGTTTTPVGISHGYSPLEQYRSDGVSSFSPQSDVYSLAATLYKLLTGVTPPEAMDVIESGLNFAELRAHEISQSTIDAIAKAMKTRDKRTQSIDDFVSSLSSEFSGPLLGAATDSDDTIIVEENDDDATEYVKSVVTEGTHEKAIEGTTDRLVSTSDKTNHEKKKVAYFVIAAVVIAILVITLVLFKYKNTSVSPETSYAMDNVVSDSISPGMVEQSEEKEVHVNVIAEEHKTPGKKEQKEVVNSSNDITKVETSAPKGSPNSYTVEGVTFVMKSIPKGKFVMGATSEMDYAYEDETPTHLVELKSFQIGETEVTQALWAAVMGTNPSLKKGDDLPVENVSWNDCKEFITKLNTLLGKKFRLPTEAEWEYAARGGAYSKDTQYSGNSDVNRVGWYNGNSGNTIHSVKTKSANELGIFDMCGNVAEWCQDWYGEYHFSAQLNPKGVGSGSQRVVRGGGFSMSAKDVRNSCRASLEPGKKSGTVGFRLAL